MRHAGGIFAGVVSSAFLLSAPAFAQPDESADPPPQSRFEAFEKSIEIHGFGGWAYADSDGNPSDVATRSGNWNTASGGLLVSARPADPLAVHMQVSAHADHGHGDESEGAITLDRFFVDWSISDQLKFRGGKVPHAIGIYSEVFDIGTLRPFYALPHSVYSDAGVSGEAYEGVGITGYQSAGSWAFSYDLYFGEVDIDAAEPFDRFGCGLTLSCDDEHAEREIDDVVGGRLVLETPLEGLSAGGAWYLSANDSDDHRVAGAQLSFNRESLRVASEYYNTNAEGGEHIVDSAYVEAGHRLFQQLGWSGLEHVELVARFEWARVDFEDPAPTRLTRHRSVELGMNYWVLPEFVFRVSYQNVRGNLFAHDIEEIEAGVLPDRTTNAFLAGLQASF